LRLFFASLRLRFAPLRETAFWRDKLDHQMVGESESMRQVYARRGFMLPFDSRAKG
jgi:hypothetical protein